MSVSISPNGSALQTLHLLKVSPNEGSAANGANSASNTSASSARTSPAVIATPQTSSLQALTESLNQGAALADSGVAAGLSVSDLLQQMQQAASAATPPDLDSSHRASLDTVFKMLLAQVGPTLADAGVGGDNLVDGSSTTPVKIAIDPSGATQLSLSPENLSLGGAVVSLSPDASLSTGAGATSALAAIQTSLTSIKAALGRINAQADRIAAHGDAVSRLSSSLGVAAPNTSSGQPDLDSVRLIALKMQQALGAQSGSITTAASQSVLSLFRS